MERLAPRACLALLWSCVLAAAAAAQGKEGEWCARGRPGPPQPGRPDPGTPSLSEPRGATRATLETDPAPPAPVCCGREGARAAFATNLGPPARGYGASGD